MSIDVYAAIWKSRMFYSELYRYEEKKCYLRYWLLKQVFLKQDSNLGNVENTEEALSKFQ